MILGFKPQFVPLILAGTKIHTIREDKQRRWYVGNTIHFATGVRTKKYKCFKEEFCTRVQDIIISRKFVRIIVDGRMLSDQEINMLAVSDGFKHAEDFFRWFNYDFQGKIIHWTHTKY